MDLGDVPFHVGTRATPSNAPFPDLLPFVVEVDSELGFLKQKRRHGVTELLSAAYEQGSQLGTPMNESGPGRAGVEDFLTFMLGELAREDLRGVRVLEIGCGTGYLLTRLHDLGASVLGIEPGKESPLHALRAGIKVLRTPFEASDLEGKFDLIVHTGVLEHVDAPAAFISRQLRMLSPDGRIFFQVPNCEASIAHGDLSIFAHEHWSYFTPATVATFVSAAGANACRVTPAKASGALNIHVAGPGAAAGASSEVDPAAGFAAFCGRAAEGREALADFLTAARKAALGIYCPGRFLNYWRDAAGRQLRFFDDDPALHGRYYPPIPFEIESRQQLLRKPVDRLLIMSRTFGPRLAETLREEPRLSSCEVVHLAELF